MEGFLRRLWCAGMVEARNALGSLVRALVGCIDL